ncbi:MAG: DUF4258 domain-containing protein [bacterium]
MEVVFTEHAKYRMATRGITRTMVISALRFPDRIGKGYNNKTLAYKTFSNGTIKVVYFRCYLCSYFSNVGGKLCKLLMIQGLMRYISNFKRVNLWQIKR